MNKMNDNKYNLEKDKVVQYKINNNLIINKTLFLIILNKFILKMIKVLNNNYNHNICILNNNHIKNSNYN
jgi:hypothetical protein